MQLLFYLAACPRLLCESFPMPFHQPRQRNFLFRNMYAALLGCQTKPGIEITSAAVQFYLLFAMLSLFCVFLLLFFSHYNIAKYHAPCGHNGNLQTSSCSLFYSKRMLQNIQQEGIEASFEVHVLRFMSQWKFCRHPDRFFIYSFFFYSHMFLLKMCV